MGGPGGKPGPSEPSLPFTEGGGWQKSYPGGNGVVAGESPYRPRGLLPRCRLSPSWPCRSGQGLGCSPIKGDRELGSEHREVARLRTTGGVGRLSGRTAQYEMPVRGLLDYGIPEGISPKCFS